MIVLQRPTPTVGTVRCPWSSATPSSGAGPVDVSKGGLSVEQDARGPDESRIERGRSYSIGYYRPN
jgi:hypothetical protein